MLTIGGGISLAAIKLAFSKTLAIDPKAIEDAQGLMMMREVILSKK